jgi:hypothetical protein
MKSAFTFTHNGHTVPMFFYEQSDAIHPNDVVAVGCRVMRFDQAGLILGLSYDEMCVLNDAGVFHAFIGLQKMQMAPGVPGANAPFLDQMCSCVLLEDVVHLLDIELMEHDAEAASKLGLWFTKAK